MELKEPTETTIETPETPETTETPETKETIAENTNLIPALVHLVWYGVDAPTPTDHPNKKYSQGFASILKNSNCKLKVWSKADCENLILEYPQYEGIYNRATNIMKFDIIRYLIVYHCGGTYLDADVLLRKPLSNITANECFFVEKIITNVTAHEARYQPIRKGIPEHPVRIANYAFSSKPKNPIFMEILTEIRRRMYIQSAPKNDYDVIYLTGPDVVTTVVHRLAAVSKVKINIIPEKISRSIFIHIFAGEWRKKK
jgi:mannosyltransferase OCH1-like enzyme